MSSFIHNPEVIIYIVNAIADNCYHVFGKTHYKDGTLDYEKLANDLMQMNVEAVNNKYNETYGIPSVSFKRRSVNKVQGLKYLQSFIYQVCDCYDMSSELGIQIQEARSAIAMSIISKMPEYDACKWS